MMSAPGTHAQLHLSHRRRSSASATPPNRRFSSHSIYARNLLMSKLTQPAPDHAQHTPLSTSAPAQSASAQPAVSVAPPKSVQAIKANASHYGQLKPLPLNALYPHHGHSAPAKDGVGHALSDTPLPSHPGSPREYAQPCQSLVPADVTCTAP